MNKFVTFASEIRVNALVCSSVAVLLSACGGGVDSAGPAQSAQQPQTAGYTSGNINASEQADPSVAQETNSAAADAPGSGTVSEHEFDLVGYEGGPFAKDDGAQPMTNLASATNTNNGAMLGGTVSPAAVVIPSTPYKLYVSPNGNDSSAGTATAPFRTLARAARSTRAGTTVFVAPGTYTGNLKTTIHGSASARIYYVSTTKWGAKIVPVSGSSVKAAWDNRGNYVDIVGFHIDGTGSRWTGGIYNGGSYDVIRGNWVHHIAKGVACTSAGGSAIGVDSYYRGVKGDVIGNLVHDIGPAGCRFVQGIYISTSGTVKNNVVYRVATGAIHLWHDANNVIITNNTLTTSGVGIIVGGGDYYHTSGPADYISVYSNIVYDNNYGVSEQGRTGTHNTYRNNLVFQNPTYNWRLLNGTQHTGTVTSNPLFVGYTRTGTPNLRLSSSSPAVGRGSPTHALNYDFLERPRNTTTGFDIGAYQL
jgi:hypothetical protein